MRANARNRVPVFIGIHQALAQARQAWQAVSCPQCISAARQDTGELHAAEHSLRAPRACPPAARPAQAFSVALKTMKKGEEATLEISPACAPRSANAQRP